MHTLLVSEIGINHNGDMGIVKELIDISSDLKIPYVKLQKRTLEDVYSKEELEQTRNTPFPEIKTNGDWKRKLEFNLEQYQEIDRYCKEKGIQWFCSPWDLKSIDFLVNYFPNMPYLKIPSAKVTDGLFLKKSEETGFDLIMSTGMCDLSMVQKSIYSIVGSKRLKYVLACTASYPCPTKDINLNQIKFLSYYFKTPYCDIGWSDHSGGVLFPSLAVSLGAKMIEVHITLDRRMYGSDQASSIEPQGLRKLVKQIEEIEIGLGEPNKVIQESEIPIIKKLRG